MNEMIHLDDVIRLMYAERRLAEDCLNKVTARRFAGPTEPVLAEAQVHATLALGWATELNARAR